MARKVKPKIRRILQIQKIRPWWNWRIKPGGEYQIMGELEDLYFIWANGTYVALPKADQDDYYILIERDIEEGQDGSIPYCAYP